MTDDEQRRIEHETQEERPEEQQDERVEDLDVPEDQSRAIKGGGRQKWSDIEL